jgi:ubiquinone biosynthesis monooxygenase Coq7
VSTSISARLNKGEPLASRILRVDHGGENGAVHIYMAQILVCSWRAPDIVAELREFQVHEERHRAAFAAALRERGIRQRVGFSFCALGGFILGLITGLMGRAAVTATTRAVERVVLRHLHQQLAYLKSADSAAYSIVASILDEEHGHYDSTVLAAVSGGVWPSIVEPIVAGATEAVIWIGMHR